MGQDARLSRRGLDLAENHVASVKRRADGAQVALVSRDTQNPGVADHFIMAGAARSQLLDDSVGDAVGKIFEREIGSLVVEANDGDSLAGRTRCGHAAAGSNLGQNVQNGVKYVLLRHPDSSKVPASG